MSSMFHEIYIYGSEIYFILLLFFWKKVEKKETLSQILSLFYWQHEIVLLSQRLIRKKISYQTSKKMQNYHNSKQYSFIL